MLHYIGLSGKTYNLSQNSFGGGGEGDLYSINNESDKCAKIYHKKARSKETEEKLKIMLNNPPDKSVLSQIAWPLDLLYSNAHDFVGFIMPRIDASDDLIGIYEYPPVKYKNLTFQQKILIAQNICAVIDGVHNAGFVFGDFNPKNIGVNMATGYVAFWDTDSYHIKDKNTGKVYRCKVCLDGYVAPELINKCRGYNYETAPLPTFTEETDNFALAIHIFKLLMNGYTPFNGIIANGVMSSSLVPGTGNIAIEQDQYCFKPGNMPLSKAVPDKSILPKVIADLFDRAFIDGRNDPKKRPTAREWYNALYDYENVLISCNVDARHQYNKALSKCPWCEIDNRFNKTITSVPKTNAQNILNNTNNNYAIPVKVNQPGNIYVPASKSMIKNTVISEIVVILLAVIILLVFYFWDVSRWKDKVVPELYQDYEETALDWNPNRMSEIVFTGRVDSSSKCDTYTVHLLGKGSSSSYNLVINAIASNDESIEIVIKDEDGGTLHLDESYKEDLIDGYTVKLASLETYTISVKYGTGSADYVLKLTKK